MQETPQQYTQRMLSHVGGQDPLRIQAATPRKIAQLIRRLTPNQLRKPPAPGKWSIGEILAHMAEAELVGGYRIRLILSKSGTEIQAFDQDAWAVNAEYAKVNPKASLEMFRVLRENNLALLKRLPREKWEYFGMHQERGKETIARVAEMFAGHDLNHLQQIARMALTFRKRK